MLSLTVMSKVLLIEDNEFNRDMLSRRLALSLQAAVEYQRQPRRQHGNRQRGGNHHHIGGRQGQG